MSTPQQHHTAHPGATADRLAFLLLLAGVAWAPWPLGSNRPWSWSVLAALMWAALVLALAGRAMGQRPLRLRMRHGPLLFMALFCGLVALQALRGAPEAPLWRTLDAFGTRVYLLQSLCYFAACAVVVVTVRSADRCKAVLGVVLVAGLLQAAVAVGLLALRTPYSLFFTDFGLDGRASGTFANPDHLAGYMQLGLAAGIGLMVAQFSRRSGGQEGFRSQSVALLRFLMSPKVLVRLALVLLVVALVMTHSRMGNGAFFITLLLVGALAAALSQRLRRPALWLVGSMVVIDVLVIGNLVGLERVVKRVQQTTVQAPAGLAAGSGRHLLPREQSLAERLEVPRLSLALVEQRPMFGWGAGSYALAFAPIKPDTVYAGYWDHAHNDYVQVAVDTGLVGLALWAGIGALTLGQALPLLRDGRPRLQQGVGAAAITALMCLGLHGMVDFNLHIPANALTLAVLSSLVWVAPSLGSPHKARSRSDNHSAEDWSWQ